jgi:hypothetical protein
LALRGKPFSPPISAIFWQLTTASHLPHFHYFLAANGSYRHTLPFSHFKYFLAANGSSQQPLCSPDIFFSAANELLWDISLVNVNLFLGYLLNRSF